MSEMCQLASNLQSWLSCKDEKIYVNDMIENSFLISFLLFLLSEFKPLPGAASFQLSNPPLLQTVSLLGSLNVRFL